MEIENLDVKKLLVLENQVKLALSKQKAALFMLLKKGDKKAVTMLYRCFSISIAEARFLFDAFNWPEMCKKMNPVSTFTMLQGVVKSLQKKQ